MLAGTVADTTPGFSESWLIVRRSGKVCNVR
jgi:hypothetical protein